MAEITVSQLAKLIKIDEQVLLQKLEQSGVHKSAVTDVVSDSEKSTLLAFIQSSASTAKKKPVTLQRKTTKQLKVSGNRKINIEVRKKRTIVAPPVVDMEEVVDKEAELVETQDHSAVEAEGSVSESVAVEKPVEVGLSEENKTDATKASDSPLEQNEVELVDNETVEENVVSEPSKDEAKTEQTEVPEKAKLQKPKMPKKESDQIEATQEIKKTVEPKAKPEPKAKAEQKENGFRITSKPTVAVENDASGRQKEKESVNADSTPKKPARLKQKATQSTEEVETRKNIKKPKGQKKQSSKSLYQFDDDGYGNSMKKSRLSGKKIAVNKVKTQQFNKPVEKEVKQVVLFEGITVNELAQKMAVKAADLIKILMKMGVMATINQPIDMDTAILIVEELGHEYTMHKEDVLEDTVLIDSSKQDSAPRAPVVTIMGHVDHGKTSLLDYIRKARVAVGEAGGITQHIGAYSVETERGQITFLDTPGHEAFTAMRARGASSTDIVILVVAADDGVMPQTIEAIQHAKAAGVPIVVAVNKIDKPEADPDRVKTELSQHDVIPEDWGGDIMFAPVSAKSGEGIDALLEGILLQAEVLELTAPQTGFAKGIVVESKLEKGRGAVATVLVQSGELKQGDTVLCGTEYGRIRAMSNDVGQKITTAGPSTPVEILGLSGVPNAGDEMIAVKDDKTAREVAELRSQKQKEERLKQQQASKLSALFDRMGEENDEQQTLNIILKADVQGSVEAIRESLVKLSNDDIKVNIIASGIGGITSSDVSLAVASQAVLFGFNVRADGAAKKQAEADEIELRYYSIIYDLIDDVKKAMSGMLSPELREEIIGIAEVRDVFRSSKFGSIAGCMVIDGVVKRNNPIRVLRDQVVIYEGALESLKRFKEDANEVKKGMECGIGVKNYNDVKVGDQIEVFETIEVKREI
ncbi:translation initiation factor IF-2 [Fangia hongkongensis]|nr:translation initiation factor IF-2 [Fangia hongkongensis]MBK2123988.1 translation initiation factor IF-2 [Fangia hongkongensis]